MGATDRPSDGGHRAGDGGGEGQPTSAVPCAVHVVSPARGEGEACGLRPVRSLVGDGTAGVQQRRKRT
ncbi:hypothetical protein B296_00002796 [Ensete ventricosum]|uniref:Uncharacterized protein n=1 Tax=Ensete ventricosum TaxID=4639 RepID=A0A426YNM7_ENSVE|nr:hypothetical protein B296_00002796 [Ensete ventricosum]